MPCTRCFTSYTIMLLQFDTRAVCIAIYIYTGAVALGWQSGSLQLTYRRNAGTINILVFRSTHATYLCSRPRTLNFAVSFAYLRAGLPCHYFWVNFMHVVPSVRSVKACAWSYSCMLELRAMHTHSLVAPRWHHVPRLDYHCVHTFEDSWY